VPSTATSKAVISGPGSNPQASSGPEIGASLLDFDSFYAANIDSLTAALAMVRACERWTKVREHRNPAGWCYRVGLNWATSRWRRRRREALVEPGKFAAFIAPADAEINHALHDALMKLPYSQRSVVVLRYWLGWSIAEIADSLEIAEGTVSSRLNRALKALRVHAREAR